MDTGARKTLAYLVITHFLVSSINYSLSVVSRFIQEAQLTQRASTLSVKKCKMLHKCPTNCIWKPCNCEWGHSRSLPLVPFDKPYTISYQSSIVKISLSCTVSTY